MKKLHLFKTVLLLCALVVGSGSAWAADRWVKTAPADLQTGDIVVIVDQTSEAYLPNTAVSKAPSATTTVDFNGDKSEITSTVTSEMQWDLIVGTNDNKRTYQFSITANAKTNYLTCTDTNNGVAVNTGSNRTFYWDSDVRKLKSTAITRWIGVYSAQDWRCYNSGTHTNIKATVMAFYKKVSSSTATTTTITYTGITNTYINQGTAAGSLSAAVTETESGDAVVGATVTWTSSDESVATIASNGAVTLVGVGSTNLKATYAGDETYAGSSAKYTLTVTDTRADADLSFDEASYTCDKFETFAAPTLNTAVGFDGEPVYSSSDTDVATVNSETGVVTINAVGTTTISVHSDATTNFQAGDAEYELTVTIHDGLTPVDPSSNPARYVKVTSTEDITDGNYLIVYETDNVAFDGSLSSLDAGNNVISVKRTDNVITVTDATLAAEFTINVTNGTVKSASGYYIGINNYGNGLKTTDDDENPYTNTLGIDSYENLEVTKDFGDDNIMYLAFNSNSGENNYRFRFYKAISGNNKAIQLYKYTAATTGSVTLSSKGYKTMVSSKPFSTTDATIYIVTANDGKKATLTSIEKAPANEPVILKGGANATVSLKEETTGSDASENILEISDASTGNGVYVLAEKDNVVAFYEWDGGSLGTGRVYLPKPASGDAREMISFYFEDEETTGINTTLTTNERMNNEVYNLNGQRVAQPTKGLYIVNGKKYIVK